MTLEVAYIGIGSNIGNKEENCRKALEMLEKLNGCSVVSCSGWYLTKPVGVENQDWYLNGVASVNCNLKARDLLNQLLDIEKSMGRVRKEKWEARIIDLDLLLYGNQIIKEKDLEIPHPLMHLRKFVLVPLLEIAPRIFHPVFGVNMKELLNNITGETQQIVKNISGEN